TTRNAILFSIFLTEKPGLSLPTTKPLTWFEVSSRAQITLMSAKVALPIHFFSPLRTHDPPSRRQVVVIPPDVAEPTRSSVRPNGADLVETHQRRQPALLLLLIAAKIDRAGRKAGMHAPERSD